MTIGPADDLYNLNSSSILINTNFTGIVEFLEMFIEKYVKVNLNRSFSIIGISSVAGDRGRAKNYLYGSAKSGFTQYLSGLRQKFNGTNLDVITISLVKTSTKKICL